MTKSDLNPLAERAWKALLAKYPEWQQHFGTCGSDDLEVAVPAPLGSNAGHLVIFTARGEMLDVIDQLLSEKALFVVMMQGDSWAGTTLVRRGDDPDLVEGQVAQVISWTGRHNRFVRLAHDAT